MNSDFPLQDVGVSSIADVEVSLISLSSQQCFASDCRGLSLHKHRSSAKREIDPLTFDDNSE